MKKLDTKLTHIISEINSNVEKIDLNGSYAIWLKKLNNNKYSVDRADIDVPLATAIIKQNYPKHDFEKYSSVSKYGRDASYHPYFTSNAGGSLGLVGNYSNKLFVDDKLYKKIVDWHKTHRF